MSAPSAERKPGPRLAIVGGLALDNVITASGERYLGRPGGNTLWASLGAALFTDSVGIVARAGTDYPQSVLEDLADSGVHTEGVRRTGERHRLRIAYQHLADGRRLQPIPADVLAALPESERSAFADSTISAETRRGADPSPEDIPTEWLATARGWHVPLVPLAAHRQLSAFLAANTSARVIADCPNRHEIVDFVNDMLPSLEHLDVFLPSTSDLEISDPGGDPIELARALVAAGRTTVVLKRGPAGVLLLGADGVEHAVPSIPVRPVDPTGAGDAFCGAFLAGLDQTEDPLAACLYGSVAASFAVETSDPLRLAATSAQERDERLAYLRDRLPRV